MKIDFYFNRFEIGCIFRNEFISIYVSPSTIHICTEIHTAAIKNNFTLNYRHYYRREDEAGFFVQSIKTNQVGKNLVEFRKS